jgi:gliding motility associated protien GldN
MKARKFILGAALLTGFAVAASAQNVNTSIAPGGGPVLSGQQAPQTRVYKKETIIPEKKPVPYPYVREADVMWAKDIWRTIDLRQRMNYPLRYPIEGQMSGGERYSLFGLLMEGIKTEEITPYEYVPNVGWKDPFSKITNLSAIYSLTGGDSIPDDEGNFSGVVQVSTSYIWQFMIQEQWFFDKKHSTMNVRIIAIAPVFFNLFDEFGQRLEQPTRSIPFIVHFPQCRRLFATHAIYNPNNDAQTISFDDLFFQRRFASTIMAESNVYGNRALTSYKTGQDILLEAEKIKNDLFIMEHDLWEY